MREYEITVILHPELEEQGRNTLLERIHGWITPDEEVAKQMTVDHWGMRDLAYPIRDHHRGYYVYHEATVEPARLKEIDRNLQYVEDVLRYLIVRKDD